MFLVVATSINQAEEGQTLVPRSLKSAHAKEKQLSGVREPLEVRPEGHERAVEALQVRAQGLDRFRRIRTRVKGLRVAREPQNSTLAGIYVCTDKTLFSKKLQPYTLTGLDLTTRGPFLTLRLGANFDPPGRSCPQG
jgi:hypothetical protein